MVYCAGKLIENLKLFYKSNRPQNQNTFDFITAIKCIS